MKEFYPAWQKEIFDNFLRDRENLKKLRQSCAAGKRSLVVDFEKILEFDKRLAEELLYNPAEFFKTADTILEDITKIPNFRLRVRKLEPACPSDPLCGLGHENVGHFVQIQGAAKDIGGIQTRKFVQIQGTVEEAGKTQFIKDETRGYEEFEDYQMIKVGTVPVELTGDLVGTVQEGDRVVVTGTLKAVQAPQRSDSSRPVLDKLIEASYVEEALTNLLTNRLTDLLHTKEIARLEEEIHKTIGSLKTMLNNKEWMTDDDLYVRMRKLKAFRYTAEYLLSVVQALEAEARAREWEKQ
jgi:DNA replicative helicase MCM subunit Mcm2 (Cdc46/Mcm family)